MVAFVPAGTPAVQLPAVNQLESIAPVQLVWARVDTVDAESNAITAVVVSKCARINALAKHAPAKTHWYNGESVIRHNCGEQQ